MPGTVRSKGTRTDPVQRVALAALAAFGVFAVIAAINPMQGLQMLFNVAYMVMLAIPAYIFTRGCVVDASGIQQRRWFARPLQVPWHLVDDVEAESDQPAALTAYGRLPLSPRVALEARRYWRQRRARDASEADSQAERLDPELVRGWLGVEEGEALEGRDVSVAGRSAAWAAGCFWVSSVGFVVTLAVALATSRFLVPFALQLLPVIAVTGLVARQQRRMARVGFAADDQSIEFVDATGVEHRVGWNDVLGVSRADGWVLHSRVGDVRLPPTVPRLARLESAVQAAMAVRGSGALLPRLATAVPDTALSRPELGTEAERGLSQSEGA